jgi:hypothetical protein
MPLGFEAWNSHGAPQVRSDCNLYSITTNQAAIAALFRVMNRYVGNLPPMPGVFPDYPAPVVRNAGSDRELTMMRWGMPPPPRAGGFPVTNTRNVTLRASPLIVRMHPNVRRDLARLGQLDHVRRRRVSRRSA